MAFSGHKNEEEKKEYFDTKDEIEEKVSELVQLIKQSKNFIAFTGAGISTAAGIQDYRSGANTTLATGAGVWEKQASSIRSKIQEKDKDKEAKAFTKTSQGADFALPTVTHMAFLSLMEAGYLKYIISQNADGLHRKSGIPSEKLTELHGNGNIEKCKKCGQVYLREYQVRTAEQPHDHLTGDKCSVFGCNGDLYDTIVNLGEPLAEKDLQEGFDRCTNADLCLVIGTSLRVIPSADMPATTPKCGGKLIIAK